MEILGSGTYFPKKIVESKFFDEKFGVEPGWSEHKSGVKTRHYVTDDTQASMAKEAAVEAIKTAGISINDIDCIISASGVMQQLLPCTAALVQRELGLDNSGIACFDINSTCLGFVTGLSVASSLLETKQYKTILLFSSDIPSAGINYDDLKSCILFGDGAAAVILQQSKEGSSSRLIAYNMETYSIGADDACVKGGSTYLHASKYTNENKEDFLFHMNGTKLYEIASKKLKPLFERTLKENDLTMDDIKMVIPHQASLMSMKLLQRKLSVPNEKFLYNIEHTGNMIAASIPAALDYAIKNTLVEKGDKIMLVGTSAGLSLGVMIFEY